MLVRISVACIILCCLCFLIDHNISSVVLTSSIVTPLVLGSSNAGNIFMCNVTVTCSSAYDCPYNSMLRVTWFRDGTNITSDSNYMVTGLSQNTMVYVSEILTSTLAIQGSVSAVHHGQYMCRAVLNDTVSMRNSTSMNLTVQSK